jgi:hypothetical protein
MARLRIMWMAFIRMSRMVVLALVRDGTLSILARRKALVSFVIMMTHAQVAMSFAVKLIGIVTCGMVIAISKE